jgi:hypothetical protein
VVVANVKEAIADTIAESSNVRRRPQAGESVKVPLKIRPNTPEIDALPNPMPTAVAERCT